MRYSQTKKTVLLIDNNEAFSRCLKQVLLPLGFLILSLRDGKGFPDVPINYGSVLDYLLSILDQQERQLEH